MSHNMKESILAYWEMIKFMGFWVLFMGFMYLLAKFIKEGF